MYTRFARLVPCFLPIASAASKYSSVYLPPLPLRSPSFIRLLLLLLFLLLLLLLTLLLAVVGAVVLVTVLIAVAVVIVALVAVDTFVVNRVVAVRVYFPKRRFIQALVAAVVVVALIFWCWLSS